MNPNTYRLPARMLQRPVKVLLVGAGGNGSQLLPGLARLHQTMIALGHPGGLDVTVVDGDTVSASNVGRQLFYKTDIGLSKAVVLTHRVNACYGLNWKAHPYYLTDGEAKSISAFDLVIGCVDTRKARRTIHAAVNESYNPIIWLDLGNDAFSGQVVLGESEGKGSFKKTYHRPPVITEFYPDILDAERDATAEKDSGPSCSLAEAIQKQAAFVNQMAATFALNMLSNLFRFGEIDHSAVFFNAKTGHCSPLPVNVSAWARFGIQRAPLPAKELIERPEALAEAA